MGTQKMFLMKTHFVLMSRKVLFFIRVLWESFFTSLFTVICFIGEHIFRLQEKFITQKRNMNLELIHTPDDYQIDDNMIKDEEESESLLMFHFPTFEEFVRNNDVHSISDQVIYDNSEDKGNVMSSRIQVSSENASDMIAKAIKEIFEPQISSGKASPLRDVSGSFSNVIGDTFEVTMDTNYFSSEFYGVKENLEDIKMENGGEASQVDDNSMNNVHTFRHDTHVLSDNESLVSDSDSDSMVCSSKSSFRSSFIDSLSDGFLSDIDFERAFEIDTLMEYGPKEFKLTSEILTEEDIELRNLSKSYGSDYLVDEDEDILQELKNIESDLEENNVTLESNSVDVNNISDIKVGMNLESELHGEQNGEHHNLESSLGEVKDNLGTKDGNKMESELESTENSEKSSSGEQICSDSEEQNGLEREWEHQDLVEQLKMEIKKVRAIGLPTILEESESPKIMDDLKPWKIEEKYQHEGTMDELHKFYKCYRERMRKLDILNYQKMYAFGYGSKKLYQHLMKLLCNV